MPEQEVVHRGDTECQLKTREQDENKKGGQLPGIYPKGVGSTSPEWGVNMERNILPCLIPHTSKGFEQVVFPKYTIIIEDKLPLP
jgi:hypothetical protein